MEQFQYVMLKCYEFLNYPFEIWGFTFSLFNITIFVWVFDTVMNFVFRMFGGTDTDG